MKLELHIVALLVAIVFFGIAYLINRKNSHGTLYLDTGNSKTLASSIYKISAKPDRLSNGGSEDIVLTEKKSRQGGLYPSDQSQMIATALAARESGFNVTKGIMENGDGKQFHVDLSGDSASLYSTISFTVTQARLAVSGNEPVAKPSLGRCRSCSYKSNCQYRASD